MGSGKAIAAFIAELDSTVRPAEKHEFTMELAEEKKIDPAATQIQQYAAAAGGTRAALAVRLRLLLSAGVLLL